MKKYKLICKKGEGTFSEVVKAENIESGKCFAIKCMKTSFDSFEQVTNLREIQALKRLTPHPNIIHLEEVLFDEPSGRLAMVFELMDANLYDLISGRRQHLDSGLVCQLGHQMFVALAHMHGKGIFHRDIKPENILVDSTGKKLKLADLGSCRSTNTKKPMTEYIATRWYRSPECLLTDGHYGPEMDLWGAGCVLFEIIALFPLFPGADEVDQVNRIHKVVGNPKQSILDKLKEKGSQKINYNFPNQKGIGIKHFIPHASPECVDLLNQTLVYDTGERIVAKSAIEHPYFTKVREKGQPVAKKTPQVIRKTARIDAAKKASKASVVAAVKTRHSEPSKLKRSIKPHNASQVNTKLNNLKNIKSSLKKTKLKTNDDKETKATADDRNRVRKSKIPGANSKLPKLEKSDPKPQKPVKHTTKPTGTSSRRKLKYGHISSSGYGRITKKPDQPKVGQTVARGSKEAHNSAGTEKTASSSISPNVDSNVKTRTMRRINRQPRNMKATSTQSTEKKIKRRTYGTRLPSINVI